MKKVLVVQPFGIGDALFVTPLIRALKEEAKVERIDLLLGSRTREAFEANPFIDEIMSLDRDKIRAQGFRRTFSEIASLILYLRKKKYDLLVDCSMSREYAFYAKFLAGIPELIGFDYRKRGVFLSRKIPLPLGFKDKHVIEYYSALGDLVGVKVRNKKPDFFIRAEDEASSRDLLAKKGISNGTAYLAVSPGGGESWGKDAHFKRWSPAYFAETANFLLKEMGLSKIVILGSPKERILGEEVLQDLRIQGVNLCGETSLGESAAVLKNAKFLLANDSGMVHMARALEVPLAALYGPVDEKVYGPYPPGREYLALGRTDLDCRPCYQSFRYKSDCPHRDCLVQFKPETVLKEFSRLLSLK